jgi:hypothetical protein
MSLVAGGLIPWSAIASVFYGWALGNIVISAIFVAPILYIVTPMIREHELFVQSYWQ